MGDNKKYTVSIETNDELDATFTHESYSEALNQLELLYSEVKALGIEYESTINVPLIRLTKYIHLANGERVTISINLI